MNKKYLLAGGLIVVGLGLIIWGYKIKETQDTGIKGFLKGIGFALLFFGIMFSL